jgi:hypothetical protein
MAVERVARDQDHRLTGAMILVLDLDIGAILLTDSDFRH